MKASAAVVFLSTLTLISSCNHVVSTGGSKNLQKEVYPVDACLEGDENTIWINETGVQQDLGYGSVPESVQVELHQSVCHMNAYFVEEVQSQKACLLSRKHCLNRQSLCAFWAMQGQCSNRGYKAYMRRQCPLSCRLCHLDVMRGEAFISYLAELEHEYNSHSESTRRIHTVVEDRLRTLRKIIRDLGIDFVDLSVGRNELTFNFVEELIQRLEAVIPSCLSKLYSSSVTEDEMAMLLEIFGVDSEITDAQLLSTLGRSYRKRGTILSVMEPVDHLVNRPIQLTIGFGIPNKLALETLRELNMPVLEMGSGTGYWVALMRDVMGIDVLAFDDKIPGNENEFFDFRYTDRVSEGSCLAVLDAHPDIAKSRALLLIWPNDPDPIDNPEFCQGECGGSQPVWDTACLTKYMDQSGGVVIYVGERKQRLQRDFSSSESGLSATREFQDLLETSFDLVSVVEIPRLWLNYDDMTIWKRKQSDEKHQDSKVNDEF